jgi:hypothetical protein
MSQASLLLSRWRPVVGLVTAAAFLFACTLEEPAKKRKRAPSSPDDDYWDDWPAAEQPIEPDNVNTNSGAFGASSRPNSGVGSSSGTVAPKDAGPVGPPDGGGPRDYCGATVMPGDLAIVEIMITSRAGAGDQGEWVEIQSTRDCWLKLTGVTVESPRGAADANVARAVADFELAPHGTFVVADSADPVKNNALPGAVFAWEATDVLRNDGDTILVKSGAIEVDKLTYPPFNNLVPGRSLSFPTDCAMSERNDWARWSLTFGEFTPGFRGTPNKSNDDVACF